jgi:hypothetical protein
MPLPRNRLSKNAKTTNPKMRNAGGVWQTPADVEFLAKRQDEWEKAVAVGDGRKKLKTYGREYVNEFRGRCYEEFQKLYGDMGLTEQSREPAGANWDKWMEKKRQVRRLSLSNVRFSCPYSSWSRQ